MLPLRKKVSVSIYLSWMKNEVGRITCFATYFAWCILDLFFLDEK